MNEEDAMRPPVPVELHARQSYLGHLRWVPEIRTWHPVVVPLEGPLSARIRWIRPDTMPPTPDDPEVTISSEFRVTQKGPAAAGEPWELVYRCRLIALMSPGYERFEVTPFRNGQGSNVSEGLPWETRARILPGPGMETR